MIEFKPDELFEPQELEKAQPKPEKEAEPVDMTLDFIKKAIKEYPIVIFMKGEKEQPQCKFSRRIVNIFNSLDVEYRTVNILVNEDLRAKIKVFSNWPTIPQVYINGKFIGGLDIV